MENQNRTRIAPLRESPRTCPNLSGLRLTPFLLLLVLSASSLAALQGIAYGQATSFTLEGIVKEATGAAVGQGFTVEAINQRVLTGWLADPVAKTRDDGSYTIVYLDPFGGKTTNVNDEIRITVTDNTGKRVGGKTYTATQAAVDAGRDMVDVLLSGILVDSVPGAIPADGTSRSAIKVTVQDENGDLVTNDTLTITPEAGKGTVGAITNNGDGTYTATYTAPSLLLTASTTDTLTVASTVLGEQVSSSITLQVVPTTVTVALDPNAFSADSAETGAVVVTVNRGVPVTDETIQLELTRSDGINDKGAVGPVTNNGDGTYTATYTPAKTAGRITLVATATGAGVLSETTITINAGPPANIILTAVPETVSSQSTSLLTAKITDVAGNGVGGQTLNASTSGTGTIGAFSETGTFGEYATTYTAPIVGAEGTEDFTITVAGSRVTGKLTLKLTPVPPKEVKILVVTGTVLKMNSAIPVAGVNVTVTVNAKPPQTIQTGNDGIYTVTLFDLVGVAARAGDLVSIVVTDDQRKERGRVEFALTNDDFGEEDTARVERNVPTDIQSTSNELEVTGTIFLEDGKTQADGLNIKIASAGRGIEVTAITNENGVYKLTFFNLLTSVAETGDELKIMITDTDGSIFEMTHTLTGDEVEAKRAELNVKTEFLARESNVFNVTGTVFLEDNATPVSGGLEVLVKIGEFATQTSTQVNGTYNVAFVDVLAKNIIAQTGDVIDVEVTADDQGHVVGTAMHSLATAEVKARLATVDVKTDLTAPPTNLLIVEGTIRNPDGSLVEAGLRVTVTLRNNERTVVTKDNGTYTVPFLDLQGAAVAESRDTVEVRVFRPSTGESTVRTVQLRSKQILAKRATVDVQFPSVLIDVPSLVLLSLNAKGDSAADIIVTTTDTAGQPVTNVTVSASLTGIGSVTSTATNNGNGTYTVGYTVSKAIGAATIEITTSAVASPTETVKLTVVDEIAPTAVATADPTIVRLDEPVTFDGRGSTDNVAIKSFSWDFDGDGVVDSTVAGPVTFRYASQGVFSAKLTVTDTAGNKRSIVVEVTAGPPTVTAISPNSGATIGGTVITITGTNFVDRATVTIGGEAATHVTVVSATEITAQTPAGNAGEADVVVTNPDNQSGRLTNGFTYLSDRAVVSIQPPEIAAPPIGAQFTVNIHIKDAENVAGYQITVTYDETALKYNNIEIGDFPPPGAFATPPIVEAGKVTLSTTSLAGGANGDGKLATVTFEGRQVKASTINLINVTLTDSGAHSLGFTTQNDAVMVFLDTPELRADSAEITINFRLDAEGKEFDLNELFGATDVGFWEASVANGNVFINVDKSALNQGKLTITPLDAVLQEDPQDPSHLIGTAEIAIAAAKIEGGPEAAAKLTVIVKNKRPVTNQERLVALRDVIHFEAGVYVLTQGEKTDPFEILGLIEDEEDGDKLEWDWEPKDNGKIRAVFNSAFTTVFFLAAPSATGLQILTLTATDSGGASIGIPLLINFNQPPTLVEGGALEMMFLEGELSAPYGLSDVITDPDGNEVSYDVIVPPTTPFQRVDRGDEDVLIFEGKTENTFGEGVVRVTADDGMGGVATFDLKVTIEEVNDPPRILKEGDEIPPGGVAFPSKVIVSQGKSHVVENLDIYVVDPDNFDEQASNDDTLTWTAAPLVKTTDKVIVELDGSRLTLRASFDAIGTFSLKLTVSDGEGENSAFMDITINIVRFILPSPLPNSTNGVPLPLDFPPVLLEDETFTLDLVPYVEDTDDYRVERWEVDDIGDLESIEISPNGVVTFKPKPNWHGKTTVTITVFDTEVVSASSQMEIVITSVPEPPVLNLPREGITFAEGDSETVLLPNFNWAKDDDQQPLELEWQAEGSENLNATVSEFVLTITPREGKWHGTESITLTVADRNQDVDGTLNPLSVTGQLTVTVTPFEEPPRFLIEEDTLRSFSESDNPNPETGSKGVLKWEEFVEDDDDLVEELTIELDSDQTDDMIQVDVNGSLEGMKAIIFTVADGDWHGAESKTFRVIDTGSRDRRKTYIVVFSETPEAPRLTEPFDSVQMKEDEPITVDLEGRFSDDETKEENLEWRARETVDHLEITFSGLEMKITPVENWNTEDFNDGTPQTIIIIVTDTDELETESNPIEVTITVVDDSPIFENFTVQFEEDSEFVVDLRQYVSDPDLPEGTPVEGITFSVGEGNPNIEIDLSDPSNAIFKTKEENWFSTATVTLTLKATEPDTELFDTATVTITVIPINDPPIVTFPRVDDEPLDDFATRVIRFKVRDPDALDAEGQIIQVSAFYRLSNETESAAKECQLQGADEQGRAQKKVTDTDQEVTLIWFSGIDDLADASKQVIVELEVIDVKGDKAVGNQPGMRPQTDMFTLDNTDRVTPQLNVIKPFNNEKIDEKTGEMGFQLVFVQSPKPKPDILVEVSPNGKGEWASASVRAQGATVSGDERIRDLFLKGKEAVIFWNVVASNVAEGTYDLRLTPIDSGSGEPQEVGPSFVQEGIEVTPPKRPSGLDVRIFPPSRIITPGMEGYNDNLEVIFRVQNTTQAVSTAGSELVSEFAVYSLSGVMLYSVDKSAESYEELSDGWFKYSWNGRDESENLCPSGLHICLLTVDGKTTKITFVIAR